MPHITTCRTCGTLYQEVSEEAANDPRVECSRCYAISVFIANHKESTPAGQVRCSSDTLHSFIQSLMRREVRALRSTMQLEGSAAKGLTVCGLPVVVSEDVPEGELRLLVDGYVAATIKGMKS